MALFGVRGNYFEEEVEKVYKLAKTGILKVLEKYPSENLDYREAYHRAFTEFDMPFVSNKINAKVLETAYYKIKSEHEVELIFQQSEQMFDSNQENDEKSARIKRLNTKSDKYETESYQTGIPVDRLIFMDIERNLEIIANGLDNISKAQATEISIPSEEGCRTDSPEEK